MINSSVFLSFKKPLEAYEFQVFQTKSCPRNQKEWLKRSSALNCTEWHGYMCMPDENFTILLEFCYKQKMVPIENGKKGDLLKAFHHIYTNNKFKAIYM